jgi:hypothetical protein
MLNKFTKGREETSGLLNVDVRAAGGACQDEKDNFGVDF